LEELDATRHSAEETSARLKDMETEQVRILVSESEETREIETREIETREIETREIETREIETRE